MRSRSVRTRRPVAGLVEDDFIDRGSPPVFLLQVLGWSPRDTVGFLVGVFATGAILINVLFLQSGPHPAPMFKSSRYVASDGTVRVVAATLPRPRPGEVVAAGSDRPVALRSNGEVIADIQRELAQRGFYDGSVDGLYGPKTDAAIRDFEQAAGLKSSVEPSEALLRAITRANVSVAKKTVSVPSAVGAVAAGRGVEPAQPAPSRRVMAVQRALADYGYGQIRPTGVVDVDTQAAIEKFERERKLPITRQVSDRVMRELTAMTGRPLE